MQKNHNIPVVCGLVDAALIFVATFILAAVAGKTPTELIKLNPWLLFCAVFPCSIFVGWRGMAHTKKLVAGNRGWLRPAIEGFFAGFLPVPFIEVIGIVNEAAAAGPHLDMHQKANGRHICCGCFYTLFCLEHLEQFVVSSFLV